MKLVIGGAFQGKLAYAEETYHVRENWIDGRSCSFGEIMTCSGVHHFHEYIRRLLAGQRTIVDADQEFVDLGHGLNGQNTTAEAARENCEGWFVRGNFTDMEKQAEAFTEELYRKNPDIIIVSNELGYGVVPMERFDRDYRETVGRVCTCIAARSDAVTRVVCGIGTRIK